ncbi:MAG: hypothetical protein HY047_02450 [Acidobacteria bacterium]|nr:hypothetical protein [Acidobacteriota bacterium]
MSALDAKIDRLYQLALGEFTAARNALATSLTGAEATLVKTLVKPTVVPWAVNQVYWRARPVYDRLLKSGERLRKAQIGALEGRSADVIADGDAHRRAAAEAVQQAERLASDARSTPHPDALMRTFEALSLAAAPIEPHGRLTQELQPAGLEALAGITPKVDPHPAAQANAALKPRATSDKEAARRLAEIKSAEENLARAEATEQRARQAWEQAHDELLAARKKLSELKSLKGEV